MSKLSNFGRQLRHVLNQGSTLVSLHSLEWSRVKKEAVDFGIARKMPVMSWDALNGFIPLYPRCYMAQKVGAGAELIYDDPDLPESLKTAGRLMFEIAQQNTTTYSADMMAAINLVASGQAVAEDAVPEHCLFVFQDCHYQIDEPMATRLTQIHAGEHLNCQVEGREVHHPILFAHIGEALPLISHLVVPIRLPLLSSEEMAIHSVDYIASAIKAGDPNQLTGLEGEDGAQLRLQLAGACTGLLHHQANDVLTGAIKDHGHQFTRDCLRVVRDYRRELINAEGLLTVYDGNENFGHVGGLDALKAFMLEVLQPANPHPKAKPRGIMLPGVSGTGKTLIARAAGGETGRMVIQLDIGNLMGGIVGDTEKNIRRALDTVRASGRCIMLIDEVEKALAGAQDGRSDGGVAKRMLGTLLEFMNDPGDAVVICTANDITSLPPEFSRAERFDKIVFLDIPGPIAKKTMWEMYVNYYELPAQPLPNDQSWTGAEIATCARLAALRRRPLKAIAPEITPVAKLNAAVIDNMRQWAEDHGCSDPEFEGAYKRNRTADNAVTNPPAAPQRRITRPSAGDN